MINFRWENKSNERYYNAVLTQDLFGDWVVIKSWGSKARRGGSKTFLCASYGEGINYLEKMNKLRERRGYGLLSQ